VVVAHFLAMARVLALETPAVVAQRLSDLLLSFPSAAAGGVQWQTLVRKYNERYQANLNIAALGYESPLTAATTLLWDVVRFVDTQDTDNPVIGIEDRVALTPTANAPATWPSLYQVLVDIVHQNGMNDEGNADDKVSSILVSQLKPLLQRSWHNSFDEASLNYLTEEGTAVKVKKMKHLLQALLRWREERAAWKAAVQVAQNPLDTALEPKLELVPSKQHNDLLLRCVQTKPSAPRVFDACLQQSQHQMANNMCPFSDCNDDAQSFMQDLSHPVDMIQEIEMLRSENERLRQQNCILEKQSLDEVMRKALVEADSMADTWDDPSEPPPFQYWSKAFSPASSTGVPSDFGFSSGCMTPMSARSSSEPQSGTATPTVHGQMGPICTMVPMWVAIGDRCGIPRGVVQQACAIFEAHKELPSQLLRPAMSCPGEVRLC
jgi:hypothetical protein